MSGIPWASQMAPGTSAQGSQSAPGTLCLRAPSLAEVNRTPVFLTFKEVFLANSFALVRGVSCTCCLGAGVFLVKDRGGKKALRTSDFGGEIHQYISFLQFWTASFLDFWGKKRENNDTELSSSVLLVPVGHTKPMGTHCVGWCG